LLDKLFADQKSCFSWGAMWFEELENKIRSPLKH
jgi:hypothetical protein